MLRKKFPRNWRLEKTLLQRRKWSNSTKDEWIFYAAWSGVSNSEFIERSSTKIKKNDSIVFWKTQKIFNNLGSPSSYDSTYVLHQALITSSSRKPSREVGMLRNTREKNTSVLGNVFDCQHARRHHVDWITQWFKKFGNTNGNSEKRRNWEKWERRTIAINTFTLLFAREKV